MSELNAKSREVASLCAQRKDKDVAIQFAEAHLCNIEVALQTASQQKEIVMAMARAVASGQRAILRQSEQWMEQEKAEQAAQASRASSVLIDTDRQVS